MLTDINHLNDILQLLKKYDYKGRECYTLGLSLGLSHATLDVIERNHRGDCVRQFQEILSAWLRKDDNVKSLTWHALINALRSIEENAVADGIHNESKLLYSKSVLW